MLLCTVAIQEGHPHWHNGWSHGPVPGQSHRPDEGALTDGGKESAAGTAAKVTVRGSGRAKVTVRGSGRAKVTVRGEWQSQGNCQWEWQSQGICQGEWQSQGM